MNGIYNGMQILAAKPDQGSLLSSNEPRALSFDRRR